MPHLLSTLFVLLLSIGCRSTVDSTANLNAYANETSSVATRPVALGEDYSCVLNRKGQALCQDLRTEKAASWQALRAANSIPVLRNLVARATVVCGIGVRPASLENRILCWQPRTARKPGSLDQDAILLSAKMNSRLRDLSLQKNKVCALYGDGQVGCGDLMISSQALKLEPVKGLRLIRSLHSGDNFSCGTRSDTGAIFCWGENNEGQLGLGGTLRERDEAVAIAGFYGFATQVETGSFHACAINQAGEVYCWGQNRSLQLGVEGERHSEPQIVRGLPAKAEGLALGAEHSCAQLVNGSVWCWGAGDALGSETRGGLIPLRVPLPAPAKDLMASSKRSCARLGTGAIYCWGTEPELFHKPL